jgi:DNA replication and repair protein RecF
MWLEKLHLTQFKNYEEGSFTFSKRVNCIVGDNGSGKTNLLDAIYFLALTKSAFQNQDTLCINHSADFFVLDGIFHKQSRQIQITCSLQKGHRKVLMSDKKNYDRLSDHIGLFPLVMIAPDDTDLIKNGGEDRRKFFDAVLAQLQPGYLQDFLQYNKLLHQRNSLLKIFGERNYVDQVMLETYDEPLIELSYRIFRHRKTFIERFAPVFRQQYAFISDNRENVDIVYESEVSSATYAAEFRICQARDLHAQRTLKGVHKDEYVFEIDQLSLKKFASQGQQKSFAIALKLAQFELLAMEKGIKPLLLLDDIFDKLDDRRITKMITLVENGLFGQVFITDARPERSQEIFKQLSVDVLFFHTGKSSMIDPV